MKGKDPFLIQGGGKKNKDSHFFPSAIMPQRIPVTNTKPDPKYVEIVAQREIGKIDILEKKNNHLRNMSGRTLFFTTYLQ